VNQPWERCLPLLIRSRRCFAALAAAHYLVFLLLGVAGCSIPEERWLDDSSGFVYAVGTDKTTQEIRFYDMAQRAERVIWIGTTKAGVEIDSAEQVLHVIQSKREPGDQPLKCQLSTYAIKSARLLRTTRWMTWNGTDANPDNLALTPVPNRPSRFPVCYPHSEVPSRCAILNTDAESLIDVPGLYLEVIPDGSGFFALRRPTATDPSQSAVFNK
jgi:hypothetical protein